VAVLSGILTHFVEHGHKKAVTFDSNDDQHQHEVNIQRAGDRGAAACCGARRQVTTSAQTACVEYGPPEARFWSNLSISTFFSLLCWLPASLEKKSKIDQNASKSAPILP